MKSREGGGGDSNRAGKVQTSFITGDGALQFLGGRCTYLGYDDYDKGRGGEEARKRQDPAWMLA